MKLKPLGRRGAIRGLAVTGVAIASVASLVMTQAPAFADPTITYLLAGSDTTQDVMNAFTTAVAGNLVGSFDAVNPVSKTGGEVISAAKTGTGIAAAGTDAAGYANPRNCSFTRPNGSGQGNTALRVSMGSTNSGNTPPPGETVTVTGPNNANPPVTDTVTGPIPSNLPQLGCVDIGRSSSGVGSNNLDTASGKLIYIPFALDAVADSIGSTTNSIVPIGGTTAVATPATNLGALEGVGFDLTALQDMYHNGNADFPHGVTSGTCYVPNGSPTPLIPANCTTQVHVDLYVPQSGSGTRTFWLTTMWAPAAAPTSLPTWVFDHIQSDGGATPTAFVNQLVEEHDGTAVSADPNGIAPFSISQFVAQNAGHDPRFYSAHVEPADGIAPLVSGKLNPAYSIKREVYNIVAYDRVVDQHTSPDPFDAGLASLLVGSGSQLCQDGLVITSLGFASLASAPLGHHCGDIDTTHLRAFGPTTGF